MKGKSISKIALALFMAFVIIFPSAKPSIVADAATGPGLKYATKIVFIGKAGTGKYTDKLNTYTDGCTVPITNAKGYAVRYQAIGKNASLVRVSKNGKVKATGTGVGTAEIRVTFSMANRTDVVRTFKVAIKRNAVDVKLATSSENRIKRQVVIGQSFKLTVWKSYDGSYSPGKYGNDNYQKFVTDTVKINVLTPDLLSANGLTVTAKAAGTARFEIVAYQKDYSTGKAVDKATGVKRTYTMEIRSNVPTPTPTPSPSPTPTPTPTMGVRQTERNLFELQTHTTYATDPANTIITIRGGTTNFSVGISSVKVHPDDPTRLIIETQAMLDDGLEYTLRYEEVDYKFTATDGVVTSMRIVPLTVVEYVYTPIYVYLYGGSVLLDKYTESVSMDASYNSSYDIDIEDVTSASGDGSYVSYGRPLSSYPGMLYIRGKNRAAVLRVTFYTGETNAGWSERIITTTTTIRAIEEPPVRIAKKIYTIDKDMPDYEAEDFVRKNYINKESYEQYYLWYYMEDTEGNDITYTCTFASNNPNYLDVRPPVSPSPPKGVRIPISAIYTSNNASSASIRVTRNNVTYETINVVLRAASRPHSIELSQETLSLSTMVDVFTPIQYVMKDQYGDTMSTASNPLINCVSAPNDLIFNQIHLEKNKFFYSRPESDTLYFKGYSMINGTYRFRITIDNVTTMVTVGAATPNVNAGSSYEVILSASYMDSVFIPSDYKTREITFRVAEKKGGVVYSYIKPISDTDPGVTIRRPDGTFLKWQEDFTYIDDEYVIKVIDRSKTPIGKLSAGTYTITARTGAGSTNKTFNITDTQPKLLYERKFTLIDVDDDGELIDYVIKEAFEFSYQGRILPKDSYRIDMDTPPTYTWRLSSSTDKPVAGLADTAIKKGYILTILKMRVLVDISGNGGYLVPFTIDLGTAGLYVYTRP